MNLYIKAVIAVAILATGAMLSPRPPVDVSPNRVLTQALQVNRESSTVPVARIRRDMREGCTPILEGSDKISGRDTWAIRLKPPHRRYPWIEMWVEKNNNSILAWKVWGHSGDRVTTIAQSHNQ